MSNIKQIIDENIYQNGRGLIRGDILNNVLKAMVDDYDEKLEWCGLSSDGNTITLEGETTALSFNDVKALVDDPTKFVALKFGDIFWLLPQYDDLGGAIVFTGTSLLSEQGDLWRIAINEQNQVSQYSIALENQYLKTDDLSKEKIGNFNTYPTTHAVNGKLSELEEKTDAITREDTSESDDAIIYEDNEGQEVGRIDGNGADFKNLKSNGKPVLIEDVNETDVEDQEVLFSKEDDSEVYAKVGEYGVKSKAFLDLDGNPVEGAKSRRDNTIYFGDNDPINKISESLGFASMFEDWGFIGDSLTSGYIAVDNVGAESPLKSEGLGSIGRNIYRMSWGQILCRMCGTKGTNFSLGGATTASWLSQFANGATNVGYNSDGTIGVNFLSQKKTVYTICLGTNDSGNNLEVGNIATDVDLNNYNNNANTFAGNYAKIIQMCKEMTPSCKIFLITPFKWWSMGAESKGYNSIVRQLATLFSKVYLIDLYNYGISSANDYAYQAHCNTQGYTYVAYVIAGYIDYIIRNHPEDFKYHCLIPSLKEGMDNGNY